MSASVFLIRRTVRGKGEYEAEKKINERKNQEKLIYMKWKGSKLKKGNLCCANARMHECKLNEAPRSDFAL